MFNGMILGFNLSAPIGAIGALCIQQTIREGFLVGFSSGLGAATANALYGIIAGLGLSFIKDFLLKHNQMFLLVGGLALCYLAIKIYFSTVTKNETALHTSLLRSYLTTCFLTMINPMSIVFFSSMMIGLEVTTSCFMDTVLFIVGIFTGSVFWWFFLTSVTNLFRFRINEKAFTFINKLSGLIVLFFGIKFIYTALY